MSSPALVSVVVPCWNCERTLAETMESVLGQQGVDLEVIAVDDGSTDGTVEILAGYAGRARVLSGPNRGASAARQAGTDVATGTFVQYVDADDVLLPGALKARLDVAEGTGADVVYSGWQELVEANDGAFREGAVHDVGIEFVHADPEVATFTGFWAPPVAVLYRRSIVDRIGAWSSSLPVIQDARFLQDAAYHRATFARCGGVDARHRRWKKDSLSRRSPEAFVRDVYRNAVEVTERWSAEGRLDGDRKSAAADVFGYCARELARFDAAAFAECLERLVAVERRFRPKGPRLAGLVGRVVGMPAAARALAVWDQVRRRG